VIAERTLRTRRAIVVANHKLQAGRLHHAQIQPFGLDEHTLGQE
jgi:hypothetical protein